MKLMFDDLVILFSILGKFHYAYLFFYCKKSKKDIKQ